MLIHDTCEAQPGFLEKALSAEQTLVSRGLDVLWCCKNRTFNILIGTRPLFDRVASLFKIDVELSKYDAWLIEMHHNPNYAICGTELKIDSLPDEQEYQGMRQVYTGGVMRMVALLPSINLQKFFCLNNFETDPTFSHSLRL